MNDRVCYLEALIVVGFSRGSSSPAISSQLKFAGIRGVGFRMDESEGRGSWAKRYGPAADAGWTLSGSVIGCLLIGYMLGEYFDANPAAMLIGLFTGIVVGMYNLAKIMWRKQ